MKVVFIVNNKNNRLAKLLPRLEEYCKQANMGSVQFISTQRKNHAIDLARQATENGCDYIVAVGGDGTLGEVVNGVLQSNIPIDEYPAIGLLPHGSGNDFARTAGISNSIAELVELIQSDTTVKIDLGKIVLHKTREMRYFINIASIGLSSEVVQNLEQSSSIFGSKFNYFKNIIKAFRSYSKKEVSCTTTTWQWKGMLLQMAVANGRYFGNALCIAPDAKFNDGEFQCAIFADLSMWDYLKNLVNLKKGAKIIHPQVSYHHAEEVLIDSKDDCGIETDGEYMGLAPATLSIVPNAICFLMPPVN